MKNGISRGRGVSQKNITEDLERVKEQKVFLLLSSAVWFRPELGRQIEAFIWR